MSVTDHPDARWDWDDRATWLFLRHGVFASLAAAAVPPLAAAILGDPRLSKPTIAIALLGLCTGAAWIATAAVRHWRLGPSVAAVGLAMVMVTFAAIVARHPERNWDYINTYELPAEQLQAGIDPYAVGETTNPPTWAQLTAATGAALHATVLRDAPADVVAFWVFYVYQVLQLALLAVLLGLCYRVARDAGAAPATALVVAGVAMLVCAPLHETLQLNQLNILILVLAMAAVLLAPRHPLWAGALAGVGGAIKLYPFGIALGWLLRRRALPIVSMVVVALAIVFAGWGSWQLYFHYLQEFQRPAIVRDASLHSLASNVARTLGGATFSFAAWIVLEAAMLVWLISRERARRASAQMTDGAATASWEVIAALPLLFPLAWVHHYLLVLPLAIERTVSYRLSSLTLIVGTLLAVVLPAFDSFPLGLSRTIGAVLLIAGGRLAADR